MAKNQFHDISSTIGRSAIRKFRSAKPIFVSVISYTAASEIPGLTVAGANPELVKYTPAADAEFLYYGRCKCIQSVPATPDGKPTPALITRASLQSAKIPFLVVDAGAKIKPAIPCISFGLDPGRNISCENAMGLPSVEQAFGYGSVLGKELARASDLVVVGESIPGGTTTTLAVLAGLGVDARFKVSSSMPENPHTLKNKIVESAMKRAGLRFADAGKSPFETISLVGDPMMPSVAGIAKGVLGAGGRVMLAGGTQMCAILNILKRLDISLHERICIGTTSYVSNDPSSDLNGLVHTISGDAVPVFAAELYLGRSKKPGLQAFANGFVKEGVGAGGAAIAAMLKSRGIITGMRLLKAIEKEYETSIESVQKKRV